MKFVKFTAPFDFGHEDRDEHFEPGAEPVKVTNDCADLAIAEGKAEFVSDAPDEDQA
jgi:hypothetical protein